MNWRRITGLSVLMIGLAGAAVAADRPALADAAEHGNTALIRTLLQRLSIGDQHNQVGGMGIDISGGVPRQQHIAHVGRTVG